MRDPLDGRCLVEGSEASLAGEVSVAAHDFVVIVDAADPEVLVALEADPDADLGRAVLEAWLGVDAMDSLLDASSLSLPQPDPGAAARLLGRIAVLHRLRCVDAGPRDALWRAEGIATWAQLASIDERFAASVDDEQASFALDVLSDSAERAESADLEHVAVALRGLASDVRRRAPDLESRPTDTSRRAWAMLGRDGHERFATSEPPTPTVLAVPINRLAQLPAGIDLDLDATLTILREGTDLVAVLHGVSWPTSSSLFLVGRAPTTGLMRTLDPLVHDGQRTASASVQVDESDFAEGPDLRFDVVDQRGATLPAPDGSRALFELVESELARLHLLRAEIEHVRGTALATDLARARRILRTDVEQLAAGRIERQTMVDALDTAERNALRQWPVTSQLPRNLLNAAAPRT